MKPLLSLIIPCHNHNAVLPRLLQSVFAQSLAPEMEVVIVDDCSDIPCTAPLLPNMQIIRLPERAYTKNARLAGMEAAQGEVIAFADADDTLWGTDALEKNARLLLEKEADILHFPCVEVDEGLHYVRPYETGQPLAPVLEGRAIFSALVKNRVKAVTVWSKLYSRRLVREILEPARRIRVRRYREDVMYSLLFFAQARRYVASPHTGYGHHRVNRDAAKAEGRAVSCRYMLEDLLPWLKARGCPVREVTAIRQGLERFLRKNLNLLCAQAGTTDSWCFPQDVREHADQANF